MSADRRPNGHGPRGLASSRSARRGRDGPWRYCRSGDREQLQGNGEALIEPSTPARPPQLAQTALPQCPCPSGWVPFTRVHLGQRAGRPAKGRSHNTQHQTRQKRRTTDAGPRTTAPRKTSIPTTIEQTSLLGRRPHGRLLLFRDLDELRHAAHGRFVKARPARPTSTRLRSCRAHESPSGGSIVAQAKRDTVPRGVPARCRTGRLEEPWHAQPNTPHPRTTRIETNG